MIAKALRPRPEPYRGPFTPKDVSLLIRSYQRRLKEDRILAVLGVTKEQWKRMQGELR